MNWQFGLTLLIVATASCYLAWSAWRSWRAKSCGSGCSCAKP